MQPDEALWVDILEAKPNPLFTEEQRASLRFLRYSQSIPCAYCGRKQKIHWTLLCTFVVKEMGQLILTSDGEIFRPLTPVCQSHILQPEWDAIEEGNKIAARWAQSLEETKHADET
jgi:hypothetical protein